MKKPVGLLALMQTAMAVLTFVEAQQPLIQVKYLDSQHINLNMNQPKEVSLTVVLDPNFLISNQLISSPKNPKPTLAIYLEAQTESPQFEILQIKNDTQSRKGATFKLAPDSFSHEIKVVLNPTYIGHAVIKPSLILSDPVTEKTIKVYGPSHLYLPVTITQDEGIYGQIFAVSVTVFIALSYVSLGAQLDSNCFIEVMKSPKTVIFGIISTVILMPLISWFIGNWLLADQALFRIGSLVFACGPTASASTLWTTMLESDKELAVSLQVFTTVGSLISMPIMFYLIDETIPAEQLRTLRVPYMKLIQGLLTIVLALYIGWRFVGRHKGARKISRVVFRPLTFFVLLYIILFSSVIYWYLYRMFDWRITITSMLITSSTCLFSGILGYLISFKNEQAIAISISSIYKNSGVAFAVLLVAFENPDLYVAFVPCLTQVVLTSFSLYIVYSLVRLVNFMRRRGQPDPIQASKQADSDVNTEAKNTRSGSTSDKSVNDDEFIPMNVSDCVEPMDSPNLNDIGKTSSEKRPDLEQVPDSDRKDVESG